MIQRVLISDQAKTIVHQLKDQYGELMFHQSGGCCDGSSPMCFEKGELMINETDVWLGEIEECDYFIAHDQYEYWKHTQLIVNVVKGRGASFSLEIPLGIRFVIESRLFTDEELTNLIPVRSGNEMV